MRGEVDDTPKPVRCGQKEVMKASGQAFRSNILSAGSPQEYCLLFFYDQTIRFRAE